MLDTEQHEQAMDDTEQQEDELVQLNSLISNLLCVGDERLVSETPAPPSPLLEAKDDPYGYTGGESPDEFFSFGAKRGGCQ